MDMDKNIHTVDSISELLSTRLAPDQPKYFSEGYNIDRQGDINDIRAALANPAVVVAVSSMLIELKRAEVKWPAWPADITHAAAILAGEAGECLKAANHLREGRLTEGRDSLFMVNIEAIQTGAMAIRLLSNLE